MPSAVLRIAQIITRNLAVHACAKPHQRLASSRHLLPHGTITTATLTSRNRYSRRLGGHWRSKQPGSNVYNRHSERSCAPPSPIICSKHPIPRKHHLRLNLPARRRLYPQASNLVFPVVLLRQVESQTRLCTSSLRLSPTSVFCCSGSKLFGVPTEIFDQISRWREV